MFFLGKKSPWWNNTQFNWEEPEIMTQPLVRLRKLPNQPNSSQAKFLGPGRINTLPIPNLKPLPFLSPFRKNPPILNRGLPKKTRRTWFPSPKKTLKPIRKFLPLLPFFLSLIKPQILFKAYSICLKVLLQLRYHLMESLLPIHLSMV